MASTSSRRALHFVFKVADRPSTITFYRDVLGMKVLRHEEFEEGCKATCNGPYDGKWSKTMVGFGPEDDHFAVELTYNYGIKSYKRGNDFQGMSVFSKGAAESAKKLNWKMLQSDGDDPDVVVVEAPGGYPFKLVGRDKERKDPLQIVSLGVEDLKKSLEYWNKLLGMTIYEQAEKVALLGYGDNQCKLKLVQLGCTVDHAEAFGRIAFSCPRTELPDIESTVKSAGHTVITPLVSLDTPGKASVEVVILADPSVMSTSSQSCFCYKDGHEICFVGDEAFRELSKVDPEADRLLTQAMEEDKSDEWFGKRAKWMKHEQDKQ